MVSSVRLHRDGLFRLRQETEQYSGTYRWARPHGFSLFRGEHISYGVNRGRATRAALLHPPVIFYDFL